MPWALAGSLPAGEYRLRIQGYQSTGDAVMRADLLWRSSGGDRRIGTATASAAAAAVDGGFPGDLAAPIDASAIAAACGDSLVLKLTLVSGASPYSTIEAILTTP
ncbi:MAG TPA: hypothetical protein VFF06_11055 [Polyangia bacterium]|nr:hypothetical protein [Polyangia bacterium]